MDNNTPHPDIHRSGVKGFFLDALAGVGMGLAFIIPGFSGGSVAAILGIYERLIGAVADLLHAFKRSFKTLLPIFLGLVAGAVALMFPIDIALAAFPLPTVSFFVGLTLGGLPSLTDKIKGKIKAANVAAFLIPALLAFALCFIPTGADVNLLGLDAGGYLLLFFIGILGSSALVIPGISGSMLLLILGYYNPLLAIITQNLLRGQNVGTAISVLLVCGLGIAVGFVGISVIMKQLFKHCPRGTYFSIIGFIVGSIPTVFVSAAKDAGYTVSTLPQEPWHWIACVLLAAVGAALSVLIVFTAKKGARAKVVTAEEME